MQNPFPAPATLNGQQQINGTCSISDLVSLYDGNLQVQASIVNVATIGSPLKFTLTYNALDTSAADRVGYNWRHNYMMNLIITGAPATYVTFVSDTGRQFGFYTSGGNWYLDNDTNNPSG